MVLSIIALTVFVKLTDKTVENEFAEVRQGYFEITVEATGELVAENSMDIKGPNIVRNRQFRATPLKITDLVPEGTEVKKGDFIATLDKSAFANSLRDEQEELDSHKTELEMKILDTAVVLSTLRDEIRNQVFTAEEARITLEQSKYEPPATIRQAEIALDKSQRMLEQKRKLYNLKRAQVRSEIANLKLKLNTQQRAVDDIAAILSSFTITAPADGMVIYKKDRLGQKIAVGANLNPWDPVVATLPDLSSMLSKVFISEIDINKLEEGMLVEINVDAFQDKYFEGRVYSMANIGEQLSNSDSKVFEVFVKIDDFDHTLRPSMTTGNRIIVKTFDDVIFVPNESVHAGIDSVPFVYTKDGKKQIVVLGESNDKNIIIEKGLEPGTPVWLTVPENAEKFNIAGRELIPLIREKEREMARLEKERLSKYNEEFAALSGEEGGTSGSSGSSGSD